MKTIGEGFSGSYQEPDPMQVKMNDPERMATALYQNERFVVMADDYPVAPHHVLVIAREPAPLEGLKFADQQALWALTLITQAHMTRVLRPNRKVSVSVWGNQVKTAHIHLVPRLQPTDATHWQRQQFASDEARQAQLFRTYELLRFPEDVRAAAEFAVHQTYERLAGLEIPSLGSLPSTPQLSGETKQ